MTTKISQRNWRVTVAASGSTKGVEIVRPIDIEFQVKKTLKPEPNTCNLKIFNLSPSTRLAIAGEPSGKVNVVLEAGYDSTGLAQIFAGELRMGTTVTDGADIVTELSSGDGEKALATIRLNTSFGPGTPVDQVLREIVSTLGLGPGNVDKAVAIIRAKGLMQFSTKGVVLKGNAGDHLTDLVKSYGMEWSIQDGAVQFLQLGEPLAGQSILLNSASGLVGSPTVDSKGVLSFTSLLLPGLKPGAVVVVDGVHAKGNYRVDICEYSGQSLGNDWYAKCQGSKY